MIKRYKLMPIPGTDEEGMTEHPFGEWVLYTDYLNKSEERIQELNENKDYMDYLVEK